MEPLRIAAPLRQAAAELDRGLPIDRITTMQKLVSDSTGEPRFRTP